jgi:adenylate cyclase
LRGIPKIDHFFSDLFYEIHYLTNKNNPPPDHIVIVNIDDNSLWFVQRPDYLADIVEAVSAKGEAQVLGIDILFDEYKNPLPPGKNYQTDLSSCPYREDNLTPYEQKLACIMNSDAVYNVVLPVAIVKSRILAPVDILKKASWGLGYVGAIEDKDGIQRRSQLFDYNKAEKQIHNFSFPLAIAVYVMQKPEIINKHRVQLKSQTIKTLDNFQILPALRGPHGMFKTISIQKVWENRNNVDYLQNTFKDKIVLIGSSAILAGDLKSTPFTKFNTFNKYNGYMPGTEYIANVINSILKADTYTYSPWWANTLWASAFILFCLLSMLIPQTRLSFFFPLVIAAFNIALGYFIFYSINIIVSTGTTSLIIVLSIPLTYGYKYFKVDRLFGKYVSPDVAQLIWKNRDEVSLSGEKRLVTVVFSDIRGFTTLSENTDPAMLLKLLNEYFEHMAKIIYENKGNLNKFIGDGLMIIYGAPLSDESVSKDACNAVYSAIKMIKSVESLNEKWKKDYPEINISIGVGIHTGEVIAGNIGSSQRLEYSALGDTVNLASRLEGVNKEKKTTIIVSENTYNHVKDKFDFLQLGSVKVKGRTKEVNIYTIKAQKGDHK